MLEVGAAGASLLLGTGIWGTYAPNSPLFGPVIGRGPRERVAYLTFDDGPNPGITERILEILQRERAPATFFMVGKHVEQYPSTATLVALARQEIGNHTYTHRKLHFASRRQVRDEIRLAHQAINGVTGQIPQNFRAPHGYRGPFVARAIRPYHYRSFGWTLGVWDSACPGVEAIRARVRAGLRPGAILLLHDGDGYDPAGDRWQTAAALPGIIRDVRDSGYRLDALSTLVAA